MGDQQQQRILVTGSGGLIGSQLIPTLHTIAKQAGAKWFLYASSREVYGRVISTPMS